MLAVLSVFIKFPSFCLKFISVYGILGYILFFWPLYDGMHLLVVLLGCIRDYIWKTLAESNICCELGLGFGGVKGCQFILLVEIPSQRLSFCWRFCCIVSCTMIIRGWSEARNLLVSCVDENLNQFLAFLVNLVEHSKARQPKCFLKFEQPLSVFLSLVFSSASVLIFHYH